MTYFCHLFIYALHLLLISYFIDAIQKYEKCELVVNCTKKADDASKSCYDFVNLFDKNCGARPNYCDKHKHDLIKACTSDFCQRCRESAKTIYKDCLKFHEKTTTSSAKGATYCLLIKKDFDFKCPLVCHDLKGMSKSDPGRDCKDIFDSKPDEAKNGLYWIQPHGDKSPTQSYCDMSFAGGGWTLASYGHVSTTPQLNKNIPNMNHPNGYTWNPSKRNSSQGVISLQNGAVNLARRAKRMIMAAGNNPATGGIDKYQYVYSIDISNNPYNITFANHNRYHGGVGTANIPRMHVVAFTVTALKGETGSAKRYALAEALGVSWSDTYPTGYGFSPVNKHYSTWTKGPFFPSVHSGDRPAGGCQTGAVSYVPDVEKGCPNYQHLGWHSLYTTQKTGQTSIWFK